MLGSAWVPVLAALSTVSVPEKTLSKTESVELGLSFNPAGPYVLLVMVRLPPEFTEIFAAEGPVNVVALAVNLRYRL